LQSVNRFVIKKSFCNPEINLQSRNHFAIPEIILESEIMKSAFSPLDTSAFLSFPVAGISGVLLVPVRENSGGKTASDFRVYFPRVPF
jgi:hypothetical protein